MSDRPLHGKPLADGEWWACSYPERPPVPRVTMFDQRCRACLLSAKAAVDTGVFMRLFDAETNEPQPSVDEILAHLTGTRS